jgi:hypothetical protein
MASRSDVLASGIKKEHHCGALLFPGVANVSLNDQSADHPLLQRTFA